MAALASAAVSGAGGGRGIRQKLAGRGSRCNSGSELQGIDPAENITYYFRRVMVIVGEKASGMAVWRKSLFAMMHPTPTFRPRISGFRPPRS
jgi:hypothetical protein